MDYKLQRRATSPTMPSASPRLSLFPSTTPVRAPSPLSGSVYKAKALQRSRTAPAKSPLRQTFAQSSESKEKTPENANLKLKASATPIATPNSGKSFDSDTITIAAAQTAPGYSEAYKLRLDEREPEWEICPKPKPLAVAKREQAAKPVAIDTTVSAPSTATATRLARTDSQRQPKVTKLSALSSHPSSAPLDAPSPLQRITSLASPPHSARRAGDSKRSGARAAGETRGGETAPAPALVGVARSVSVSRANSPRALVRTTTEVGSPSSERLVERQVLTPTMVEVRNRKSQRVQLVDA